LRGRELPQRAQSQLAAPGKKPALRHVQPTPGRSFWYKGDSAETSIPQLTLSWQAARAAS